MYQRRAGFEAYKRRLAYSVTVGILALNRFILLVKSYITKVLEYKGDLKQNN